jgi:hypothetical protein
MDIPTDHKPTTNNLYCFLLPLPLPAFSLFRSLSLPFLFRFPSSSLQGEEELERLEDGEDDEDRDDVRRRRNPIRSICGSKAGTGPSPLSIRSCPLARIISSRRGWKKYYKSRRQ